MLEYQVCARRIDSHGSETTETDARLDLLHSNLQKHGTIMNTLAGATALVGTICRKDA